MWKLIKVNHKTNKQGSCVELNFLKILKFYEKPQKYVCIMQTKDFFLCLKCGNHFFINND